MKKIQMAVGMIVLLLAMLACEATSPQPTATLAPIPTLARSALAGGRTAYGFFPSPPEVSTQSVLDTYQALGQHADVALIQPNVPWQDFAASAGADSAKISDLHNQYLLAHQNGLDVVFVVDPLNGLNRTAFSGLPDGWTAAFANPQVRTAYTNYVQRIVQEFHPHYLGLASEINTYADAHPQDFPSFLSLYTSVYDMVKQEAPDTQIFVTFQWEDLNNLSPFPNEGRAAYHANWDQVEAFEPRLDVWAISTYPFVAFQRGADIPADYYTALLTRTAKPLAISEGGYTSQTVGPFQGSAQDQVDYLNAIHTQLGGRLVFWIYLLLRDLNLSSYGAVLNQADLSGLNMFGHIALSDPTGLPKPALQRWDQLRTADH